MESDQILRTASPQNTESYSLLPPAAVLDSSHVPFTHHVSMSNRNILGAYDIDLLEPVSPTGFGGNWATGPRGGKLGPQATEFRPPGYMKHKLEVRVVVGEGGGGVHEAGTQGVSGGW